jgi:hypothetical protein
MKGVFLALGDHHLVHAEFQLLVRNREIDGLGFAFGPAQGAPQAAAAAQAAAGFLLGHFLGKAGFHLGEIAPAFLHLDFGHLGPFGGDVFEGDDIAFFLFVDHFLLLR